MRRGGNYASEESTPEVKPAGVVWADIVKHRQLEAPQCWRQEGLEWERFERREVRHEYVVQAEGGQLGWWMGAEVFGESGEKRWLERKAIHTVRSNLAAATECWVKRQVDSLESGQQVNARKRTNQFADIICPD